MLGAFALFGLSLLLGSVPLAIKSTKRLRIYRQSKKLPMTAATMTRFFLRDGSGGDGTSRLPEFAFRYSVGGAEYSSSIHTDGLPFPSTEDDARQKVKRFKLDTGLWRDNLNRLLIGAIRSSRLWRHIAMSIADARRKMSSLR